MISAWIVRAGLDFCRACFKRLRFRLQYTIAVQPVTSLCAASIAEVELLLSSAHGATDHSSLFRDTDLVYTVTHRTQTVACVFTRRLDWCVEKPLPGDDSKGASEGSSGSAAAGSAAGAMLQICNVRALSVLPAHRRRWAASALLRHVKQDAFRDRMLWIELHVDEQKDRSHECLLSMYSKHGFIVLPRLQNAEYLLVCVDY
jgi:ribosomal protein S18 acetylase RimI-like enzyme